MPLADRVVKRRLLAPLVALSWLGGAACQDADTRAPVVGRAPADLSAVEAEVTAAVRAFHAADTARDAEGVIALLWPEYEMLVDGRRTGFPEVAAGARAFMANLELFHTVWSDLRVTPLTRDLAISSFLFRDSILTSAGETIRNRGSTTFLWERRGGEWRVRFGDADHYPIDEVE